MVRSPHVIGSRRQMLEPPQETASRHVSVQVRSMLVDSLNGGRCIVPGGSRGGPIGQGHREEYSNVRLLRLVTHRPVRRAAGDRDRSPDCPEGPAGGTGSPSRSPRPRGAASRDAERRPRPGSRLGFRRYDGRRPRVIGIGARYQPTPSPVGSIPKHLRLNGRGRRDGLPVWRCRVRGVLSRAACCPPRHPGRPRTGVRAR